jgi:hypothetical protein
VAVVAVLALLGALMVVSGAGAAPVPPSDFTCGVTVFTPCNQTAHFSDLFVVGTPFASAPSCPAFVTTDFALIVGTGNGVEHSIINNAGDGWFTMTWTGTVTLTAFIGDPTAGGVPDPSVPPLTGRLTEWFGGSFNKNNVVFHGTLHIDATSADGQTSLRVLDVSHANSTAANPFVPHSFEITTCG